MSATALKSTKRRFSSLNHQNFEFFCLVPRSPTHTGLICGKSLEPNISSLGPFKERVRKMGYRCRLLKAGNKVKEIVVKITPRLEDRNYKRLKINQASFRFEFNKIVF
jgi:hypothetical protein